MTASWLHRLLFINILLSMSLLLQSTESAVIPDPEFDLYDSWLNRNRSIIMMKQLPPDANTTFKKYYRSWGLDYDKEMAKKEMAINTANHFDEKLLDYNDTRRFAVFADVHISTCQEPKWTIYSEEEKENETLRMTEFHWTLYYCGTEKINTWCNGGDRLKFRLTGNTTTPLNTTCSATVIFTCPFSFYHWFLNIVRVEYKGHWWFTRAFWIILGVGTVVLVLGTGIVAFCLCERHYRKLSRAANTEHWKRFHNYRTYHSFDIPDQDLPQIDPLFPETEKSMENQELIPLEDGDTINFVPVRK